MKQKLLAVLCVLFTVQMAAWAEEKSGYCGDPAVNGGMDVKWALSEDSVLTISGTGEMVDYSLGYRPWKDNRLGISKVIIGQGVTSIGDYAFSACSNLTSITIPNSVTSIGERAFDSCSGLTSVTIPNSVTSLGDWTFSYCSSLTSITIPNSVVCIGEGVFNGCSGLTNITIPNSVTSIGNDAFNGCSGFTSITIPNSVTSIGDYAFSVCSNLTSITIPNSVTSIGDGAFSECFRLTGIIIPSSVTSIGSIAFFGCFSLTSITIPNSVTSIGGSAFYYCKNLALMTVDKDNTVYDSRDNCNAIIETATNTLTMGCMNTLIPNSVTNIGEKAFYGCDSLTSIIIPNSVTSIGKNAYSWCSSLSIVTCLNPVPPMLNGSQFYRISETAVLRVPDVEAYKASDWAKYFSNIEQTDLTAIRAIEAGRKNIPTTIHDLGGRRVTEPVKGRIYIVDGKTVVW